MDRIAFRNTLEKTSSRILFNESLIQITEYLREDERLDMTDYVDVYKMMDVQYDIREQIMMYEEDMTFTQDNFKMTHSASCMPEIFILMLMSITDMTNMIDYGELFELYKSHNWYKQKIEITLTIDDEEFFDNKIGEEDILLEISEPEQSVIRCACGHTCKDRNTIMIKNGKTQKQILVGCTCIQKTFDDKDCQMINRRLRQSSNYIEYNRKIKQVRDDIETERLRIEMEQIRRQLEQERMDATFRRCKKCNSQTVLKSSPEWMTMCVGCFIDEKNPLPKRCLIKLKK